MLALLKSRDVGRLGTILAESVPRSAGGGNMPPAPRHVNPQKQKLCLQGQQRDCIPNAPFDDAGFRHLR